MFDVHFHATHPGFRFASVETVSADNADDARRKAVADLNYHGVPVTDADVCHVGPHEPLTDDDLADFGF